MKTKAYYLVTVFFVATILCVSGHADPQDEVNAFAALGQAWGQPYPVTQMGINPTFRPTDGNELFKAYLQTQHSPSNYQPQPVPQVQPQINIWNQ